MTSDRQAVTMRVATMSPLFVLNCCSIRARDNPSAASREGWLTHRILCSIVEAMSTERSLAATLQRGINLDAPDALWYR